MRFPKLLLFIIAAVSAVALAGASPTAGRRGDGKQNGPAAARPKPRELPVVDFVDGADKNASARRRATSRRYNLNNGRVDSARFALKESDPEGLFELPASHMPAKSAIPAVQSDVVVIGEVLDAEAHLSSDKTGVYSEFDLRVEGVLKNSLGPGVYPGASLSVERRGGAVRFPSGKVLRRAHIQETMPVAGQRYVLFLRGHADTESYSIITGYNLREGQVYPLDGVEVNAASQRLAQFAAYEGVEEGGFLNEVGAALAAPTSGRRLVRLVGAAGAPIELEPLLMAPGDDPYEPPDPDPGPVATPTPCASPTTSENGKLAAWAQNSPVTVVIQTGTGQFTDAEVACLTAAFNNWNGGGLASANASGVRFNVTSSPTAVATMNPDASSPNAGGAQNVYQVSRGTPSNPLSAATTGGLSNNEQTARAVGVTLIHPQVGNDPTRGCDALARVMAHEIGHTFGLDHCEGGPGSTCNLPGTSVMNRIPCGTRDANGNCTAPDYNNTTNVPPGPTTCDNAKAKEVGQYDPTKTNQPAPPSTGGGGGGGGGGDGGGGGGGYYYYCTPYYWVYYESWDGGPWIEVDRWYAGCW